MKHGQDVVCCAFRPDGVQLCTGTIGGLLSIWNVEDGKLLYEIDGRRDISGGRFNFLAIIVRQQIELGVPGTSQYQLTYDSHSLYTFMYVFIYEYIFKQGGK